MRKMKAVDNDPPYRDEQRAWYDSLRDFLPIMVGLQPTVRIYMGKFRWCSLDPQKESDIATFFELGSWSCKFAARETRGNGNGCKTSSSLDQNGM